MLQVQGNSGSGHAEEAAGGDARAGAKPGSIIIP